jgi:hypothetical protein
MLKVDGLAFKREAAGYKGVLKEQDRVKVQVDSSHLYCDALPVSGMCESS